MTAPSSESHPGDNDVAQATATEVAALESALSRVRARIDAASTGQPPKLLPVTKSVPSRVALALADVLDPSRSRRVALAENRAKGDGSGREGLAEKAAAFEAAGRPVQWHFVGHVQRNKARRILEHTDVLHSVDSLRLIETLDRVTRELERDLAVFVQVDLTGEEAKGGLDESEVREALRQVADAPHLYALGLMAMGPLSETAECTTESVFRRVAGLGRELESDPEVAPTLVDGRCQLSIGMSADLEVAIAAGSHVVRIGSDLFEGVRRPESDAIASPRGAAAQNGSSPQEENHG